MSGLAETAGNFDVIVDGQEVFVEFSAAFEAPATLIAHVGKTVRVHQHVRIQDGFAVEHHGAPGTFQTSGGVGVAQVSANQCEGTKGLGADRTGKGSVDDVALGVLLYRAAVLERFMAHGTGEVGLARMRLEKHESPF